MSHVDDGTLHSYLDGELPPSEARELEGHVAQCRECQVRLDEERALIARADELLGLAAPPDRAIPPFRPGDRVPPVQLWWRLRVPLAWAATVVLALGAGLYLGSISLSRRLATPTALTTPGVTETVAAPSAAPTNMAATRRAAEQNKSAKQRVTGGAPAAVALESDSAVALRERAELAPRAFQPSTAPAPKPAAARMVGPYAVSGPPLTLDSARALIDTDPYAVPDLPVRGIYRARMIGYSAVVVVEQGLDSSTAIDVITGRSSPYALDAIVVSGAARPDSVSRSERAQLERARADSIAAPPRAQARPAPARGALADRSTAALVVEVRGPLSADSLAALQHRLAPLRP